MTEYRRQLEKGMIQRAYRGLMDYFWSLKSFFETKYPEYCQSSGVYYGFMDMTYFALFPKSLKQRKLKIAIVFIHEKFRFEVWLSGINKTVQAKYLKLIGEKGWTEYRLPAATKGSDSIIECVLAENPDFSDLDALEKQIEVGTLEFIRAVEMFLSEQDS